MTTFDLDKKLGLVTEELAWREVGDELVVLEMSSATYLTLNGSAKVLWLRLAESATTDELAQVLRETYSVKPEEARADVEEFLKALEERGLLKAS